MVTSQWKPRITSQRKSTDGADTVTGSTDNELIDCGAGNDVIIGSDTVDINADIASGQAANLSLRRVGTQIFGLGVTGPTSFGVDRFYSVEKANLTGYTDKLTFTEKFAGGIDTNVIYDCRKSLRWRMISAAFSQAEMHLHHLWGDRQCGDL